VPINIKGESSNPVHGEMYWIQRYVIQFASDLWQVGGFPRLLRLVSSTNYDINEILLKVAVNTIPESDASSWHMLALDT
jgi:hypothetical protein